MSRGRLGSESPGMPFKNANSYVLPRTKNSGYGIHEPAFVRGIPGDS